MTGFRHKLHLMLENRFPEKRLFLRSDEQTRFIRLGPATQLTAWSVTSLVLAWTIVATAIVIMDSIGAGNFRAQALRDQMEAAGLVCRAWTDLTEAVRERTAQKEAARAAGTPEAPGPHLVQGPGFDAMRANLARNLREWRVGVVRGVWVRPA